MEWIETVATGLGPWRPTPREVVTDGLTMLLLGRIVLPFYGFLHLRRTTALFRDAKKFKPPIFTGPHATAVPGISRISAAATADRELADARPAASWPVFAGVRSSKRGK